MFIQSSMTFKERGHSEIIILEIMRFTLLTMPIVFIFFRPLSLSDQKGYGIMMQVRMVLCRSLDGLMKVRMFWCKSLDVLVQVFECSDAGPLMVWCRSSDAAMQVLGCAKGLLHLVTFGYETLARRLIPWGHYTAGSKKIQPMAHMWSKPTPSFSNIGALLLKIQTFFLMPFSFFVVSFCWS